MAISNLTTTGCGALILCKKTKRYLFLLRNKGKFDSTWGLVGGKVEPSESIIIGLEREIQEELGGKILDAKLLPIEKYTSINNKFVYHTFLIKVDEEFVPELNDEHKGFCWVSLNDYPKPLHPGVLRILNSVTIREKLEIHQQIID